MNIIKPLLATLTICSTSAVLANEVAVPVGQQGSAYENEARPRSGMSKDQVSAQFGAPGEMVAAIGEPPISRWVYDHYTVYFENNQVIHSVLHRTP
jgi:hypothetical protein